MSSIHNEDTSDVSLDKDGNIDTQKLEKSLKSALEYDIKYKQRDNMKKRACKVAANYDDFKAMVDCAHLKTVSRQDIESLRAVKRGWKKGGSLPSSSSGGASILSQEDDVTSKNLKAIQMQAKLGSQAFKNPKTPLELGRDFKRMTNASGQLKYLYFVGLEKTVKLLNVDADAELFEKIISVISDSVSIVHSVPNSDIENENMKDQQINCKEWLIGFASLQKFGLLYQFVDKALKHKIVNTIKSLNVESESESDGDMLNKYNC